MKLKKILTALLCAATVLSIAGCANSADTSTLMDIANQAASKNANTSKSTGTSKNTNKNTSKLPIGSDGVIDWDAVPYADEADFETQYEEEHAYTEDFKAITKDTVTIIRYTGKEKLIKIPETIAGMPVRKIDCPSVIIQDSPNGKYWASNEVTGVFSGLSGASIKLPKYVDVVRSCFWDCDDLTVYLSESAKIWEDDKGLSTDNNGTGVQLLSESFKNCKNLKLYVPPRSLMTVSGPSNAYPSTAFKECTISGIEFNGKTYTGDQMEEFVAAAEADKWHMEN